MLKNPYIIYAFRIALGSLHPADFFFFFTQRGEVCQVQTPTHTGTLHTAQQKANCLHDTDCQLFAININVFER